MSEGARKVIPKMVSPSIRMPPSIHRPKEAGHTVRSTDMSPCSPTRLQLTSTKMFLIFLFLAMYYHQSSLQRVVRHIRSTPASFALGGGRHRPLLKGGPTGLGGGGWVGGSVACGWVG